MGANFTEGYTYQDNLLPEYQKKLGHDVTIITSCYRRNEKGKIIKTLPEDKIIDNSIRLIRIDSKSKIQRVLGFYQKIYYFLREIKPDFVFIHGLASCIPDTVIKYKIKYNKELIIVADTHQDYYNSNINFPFNLIILFFKYKWKQWIKSIKKIYSTTSWRMTFANEIYNIPKEKLDILHTGIDIDRIPKDISTIRKEIREELDISNDTFLFVTGGKLDKKKKTLEAIKAFKSMTSKNTCFLIFGSLSTDIQDEFYDLINDDTRIKYIGYIPSNIIYKYFLASDFGIFPASHSVLWEEAIGCGLPCLFKKYEEHDHTDINGNCIRMENFTENDICVIMMHLLSDIPYYQEKKKAAVDAAPLFFYRSIAEKSLECIQDNTGFDQNE